MRYILLIKPLQCWWWWWQSWLRHEAGKQRVTGFESQLRQNLYQRKVEMLSCMNVVGKEEQWVRRSLSRYRRKILQ